MPRIVLTSGEPAGIGPDLCLAIAQRPWPCELIVAGDAEVLAQRARQLKVESDLIVVEDLERRYPHRPGAMHVLHHTVQVPVKSGRLDAANARHVLNMLDSACDGCLRGDFDAMVTAPVQKSIINDAGVPFMGHTEYLAERTGAASPVMMLTAGKLRVALATTHLPLAAVSAALTRELLEQVLRILDHDLRARFHLRAPRILVCGLNPHSGESGHIGREEMEVITPVLNLLREQGMQLTGPVPADTAFTPHMLQHADAVLAMFHDQGLPTLKYAGFGNAINITLGLPIIRTSVDHGTALDLAGTGRADAGSLIAATELAIQLAGGATASNAS